MRGTFHGIEIGRTGINMGQIGLDITGHNIANVNTRGFTRQRVVQTANDPHSSIGLIRPTAQALVGGGTRVKIHDQIRSEFLDRRFRTENTIASYWERRTQELRSLESFFDNVNEETSINASLDRFFSAIHTMHTDTVAGAPRKEVQTTALDMLQQLHSTHSGLVDLQRNQDRAVAAVVDTINEIAEKIASLNLSIYVHEIGGHIANDLRDKRNILLDELSSIIDIEYEVERDMWGHGVFTVRIGGEILVHHEHHGRLSTIREEVPVGTPGRGLEDRYVPVWESTVFVHRNASGAVMVGQTVPLTDALNLTLENGRGVSDRGSLVALMEMRDSVDPLRPGIPASIENLNNFARALVQHVNAIHRQGFNDHPFEGSVNGQNFFHEDPTWGFVRTTGTPPTTKTVILEWNDTDGRFENAGDPTNTDYHFTTVLAAQQAGFARDLSALTIENIRLDARILESEYNIAASDRLVDRSDGAPPDLQGGNNEIMKALTALFLRNNLYLETANPADRVAIGSLDDFVTRVRVAVASTLRVSRNFAETSHNLALSAENQRLAVAGVSLDEEMTHMIRFNHAYNGAARVITAMDDALDRLINGTGRVGL